MVGRKIPDKRIVEAADDFAESSKRVFQADLFHLPRSFFVLASLAVELYLKSLNCEEEIREIADLESCYEIGSKPIIREHKLIILFDSLDETHQACIQEKYSALVLGNYPKHFRDAITPFNNVFVRFRYLFEIGNAVTGLNPNQLNLIVTILKNYVRSLLTE